MTESIIEVTHPQHKIRSGTQRGDEWEDFLHLIQLPELQHKELPVHFASDGSRSFASVKNDKCSIRDLLRASPPKHLLKKSDPFFLIQPSSNISYEFSRY